MIVSILLLAATRFGMPSGTYTLPPGAGGRVDDYGDPRLGKLVTFERPVVALDGVLHVSVQDLARGPGAGPFGAEAAAAFAEPPVTGRRGIRPPTRYGAPRPFLLGGVPGWILEAVDEKARPGEQARPGVRKAGRLVLAARAGRVVAVGLYLSPPRGLDPELVRRRMDRETAAVAAGWRWRSPS